jgi:hypothetical protein
MGRRIGDALTALSLNLLKHAPSGLLFSLLSGLLRNTNHFRVWQYHGDKQSELNFF